MFTTCLTGRYHGILTCSLYSYCKTEHGAYTIIVQDKHVPVNMYK